MKLTPFILINLWVGPELLVEALVKGSVLLLAVVLIYYAAVPIAACLFAR